MNPRTCPDCKTGMEIGFIPDFGPGIRQLVWHKGEPQSRHFLGINTGTVKVDQDEFVPLTAYRCNGCGSLKLYAPAQDSN